MQAYVCYLLFRISFIKYFITRRAQYPISHMTWYVPSAAAYHTVTLYCIMMLYCIAFYSALCGIIIVLLLLLNKL